MTTAQLYRKAERADDICDLDLTDSDEKQILENTYEVFLKTVEPSVHYVTRPPFSSTYATACKILRPFREHLKSAIRETDFRRLGGTYPASENDKGLSHVYVAYSGLYLSALLNETKVRKLSMCREKNDKLASPQNVGYLLKHGRVVDVEKSGNPWSLGHVARGGININRGSSFEIGHYATGGIFINHEKTTWLGASAKGGIFLNFGEVDPKDNVAQGASGGIFITDAERWFTEHEQGFYFIAMEKNRDGKLKTLLKETERASDKRHYKDIGQLARKIDAHVRKNYKRQVA